jgi:hypothetical protein
VIDDAKKVVEFGREQAPVVMQGGTLESMLSLALAC